MYAKKVAQENKEAKIAWKQTERIIRDYWWMETLDEKEFDSSKAVYCK
tara:strand:- start:3170 stop:3313 length:144 start_codon:yes stop_codon:yes gene_type:complete